MLTMLVMLTVLMAAMLATVLVGAAVGPTY